MNNRYLRAGFASAILLAGTYFGLMAHAIVTMSISDLIMCSADQGGFRIPAKFCEHYMKNFRGNAADMQELAIGGLDPILNLDDSKKKYEIAAFFIAKGLNVNGVNHYSYQGPRDVTPLHASVRYNDPERAKFLLEHGADLSIRSKSLNNMTALELAKALQERQPDVDRRELIRLLSNAQAPIVQSTPPSGKEPRTAR